MRRITPKQAENMCAKWNGKVSIGQNVTVRKDDGTLHEGKTTSTAYVCNSGYPVIHVEGIAGYYLLNRVTAKRIAA